MYKSSFTRSKTPTTVAGIVLHAIRSTLEGQAAGQYLDQALARKVLSCENLNDAEIQTLDRNSDNLRSDLINLSSTLRKGGYVPASEGLDDGEVACVFTDTQIASCEQAMVVASDFGNSVQSGVMPSKERMRDMIPLPSGALTRRPSIEAFDERENRNAAVYAVAYNLLAPRQDDFGETLFPTVVQANEQAGFSISIQLIQVLDELRRKTDGTFIDDMGRMNVVRALIDPSILRNDMLRAIPIYRDENKTQFAPANKLAPRNIVHEGMPLTTSALRCNNEVDFLAMSQTDAMLASGLMNSTDALDPYMVLEALYVEVPGATAATSDIFKFDQLHFSESALFTYKPQGDWRDMQMNFRSKFIPFPPNKLNAAGAASENTALKNAATAGWNIEINLQAFGEANLQKGTLSVNGQIIKVTRIRNKDGQLVDLATDGKAVCDLIAQSKIVYHDTLGRRVNTNLRERGQLVDTTYRNQLYAVPLLSPVTSLRPMTDGDNRDGSDLAALLTVTRIRTSNAAVDKLLEAAEFLRGYVTQNGVVSHDDTNMLGIARYLLSPHYERREFDVAKEVNSISTADRANDVQNGLVNVIRDMVYSAWRDSGYKAAKEALNGGVPSMPTVIIATDPIYARYLQITGDFRTISGEFNVKIVSTLNQRMRGKMFITFGDTEGAAEGIPNPMHFGNMIWKAEQSIVLPLHRAGANARELSVAPSFLHIVHLPIMMEVVVKNLSEAMVKSLAVKTQEVAVAP